jgi:tetratricopeptide (TPR) repeat protein
MQNSKGRLDDEAKEMALSERLALGETWHFGQAFYIASGAADRAKDYAKAGAALDVQVINVLRRGTFYRDLRAWVTSPSRVHYLKGRGFLADEKADEAMRELRASQELTPGDINLAIITVPILMKMGKAKFADEVFDKPWTTYTTLLKEYPDWALGHNNAAWLAARCRRQLDEALQHAQVAVRLDPERAVYLDTLAEIHFQKGDKAAAIDAIKKCIKLEPEREFFKKQLERFEAGDPKTDVPESR